MIRNYPVEKKNVLREILTRIIGIILSRAFQILLSSSLEGIEIAKRVRDIETKLIAIIKLFFALEKSRDLVISRYRDHLEGRITCERKTQDTCLLIGRVRAFTRACIIRAR